MWEVEERGELSPEVRKGREAGDGNRRCFSRALVVFSSSHIRSGNWVFFYFSPQALGSSELDLWLTSGRCSGSSSPVSGDSWLHLPFLP